jgi:hypothetical protein
LHNVVVFFKNLGFYNFGASIIKSFLIKWAIDFVIAFLYFKTMAAEDRLRNQSHEFMIGATTNNRLNASHAMKAVERTTDAPLFRKKAP